MTDKYCVKVDGCTIGHAKRVTAVEDDEWFMLDFEEFTPIARMIEDKVPTLADDQNPDFETFVEPFEKLRKALIERGWSYEAAEASAGRALADVLSSLMNEAARE